MLVPAISMAAPPPVTVHGLPEGATQDTNAVPLRVNSSGQVSLTKMAGENQTLDIVETSIAGPGSSASANITTATSTEVCDPTGSGASEVVGFYVNSTTSGTIRFYDDADGTCSSSAKGGVITPAVGWHWYPVAFSTAICALTANTIDVTVVYRCAD